MVLWNLNNLESMVPRKTGVFKKNFSLGEENGLGRKFKDSHKKRTSQKHFIMPSSSQRNRVVSYKDKCELL